MEVRRPRVIRKRSEINYDYATIKITQSRIDKGLLALPVSLAGWFPNRNETIQVYLGDSPDSQTRQYSSYASSTRECRIGGLRQWFEQNNIKPGEEIVIQFLDRERFIYRLIPEGNFILQTHNLQDSFDNSTSEEEGSAKVTALSRWTHLDASKVLLNEYFRLVSASPSPKREYVVRGLSRGRETVPANSRVLLEGIYEGHCQVCNFWFPKRDGRPYFEVHHLDPLKGHHLKNVLVVCGNCHNQFEYAHVEHEYNEDMWLVTVLFNRSPHKVNHVDLTTKMEGFFKELFV